MRTHFPHFLFDTKEHFSTKAKPPKKRRRQKATRPRPRPPPLERKRRERRGRLRRSPFARIIVIIITFNQIQNTNFPNATAQKRGDAKTRKECKRHRHERRQRRRRRHRKNDTRGASSGECTRRGIFVLSFSLLWFVDLFSNSQYPLFMYTKIGPRPGARAGVARTRAGVFRATV